MVGREVLQLWVAKLRSGDYQQGQHWLRRNGRYCCLGVLCDLAAKDGGARWFGRSYGRRYDPAAPDCESMPPLPMLDWLGFSRCAKLALMNDKGADFGAIADRIERLFPEAFALS